MLMAHGLDAAIMDPADEEVMRAIKTSDILLNNRLYADDFLRV
jgi:5-methyltetrahydrofolate corrinoid/iron sulfur protein methyltransferase